MYVMFLEMNRSWMYGDRRERDFQEGLREFCIAAVEHQRLTQEPMIFCPCRDCGNVKRWADINEILDHLYRRGFKPDYEIWYWHGEKLDINDEGAKANTFKCEGDEGIVEDRMDDMMDAIGDHLTQQTRMFEDVSNAAETPLYDGCSKYSKLSATLVLTNLQAKFGWTDTSFTSLLEALHEMFPEGNNLPN